MKTCLLLSLTVSLLSPVHAQTVLHKWLGPELGSRMGVSVAGVGDIDGDGYPDVMVGAPEFEFDFGIQSAPGFIGVYSGRTGKRIYRFVGKVMIDPYIGSTVAAGGDVDADGIPDLLFAGSPNGYNASSVSVHSGALGELLHKRQGNYVSTPELGRSLLGGLDIDGDGFDDFIATAPQPFGPGAGRLLAWSGATGQLLYSVDGLPGMDGFGLGLDSLADLDGDGVDELLVGTEFPGQVDVLSGADGALLYSVTGSGRFGRSVAGTGDLNGDGYDDFLVGAYQANADEGRAYVYSGIDGALLHELHGSHPGGQFGFSVAAPGDIDGDGVPDLLVGAPRDDELLKRGGRVTLFSGADGSVLRVLYGRKVGAALGLSVGRAGDVDGGGVPDLLAGAPFVSPYYTAELGRAFVWSGERSPNTYCTAKTSSLGCTPTIWANGTASVTKGVFQLSAHSVHNEQRGALYWSLAPAAEPFAGGLRCIGRVRQRIPVWSGGNALSTFPEPDCSGSFRDDWTSSRISGYGLVPGQTVYAQFRFTDAYGPHGPHGMGLTDALSFDIMP